MDNTNFEHASAADFKGTSLFSVNSDILDINADYCDSSLYNSILIEFSCWEKRANGE